MEAACVSTTSFKGFPRMALGWAEEGLPCSAFLEPPLQTRCCLSLETVTVVADMKSVDIRTTHRPGFAWNAQPCVATDMILILTIFPNNS